MGILQWMEPICPLYAPLQGVRQKVAPEAISGPRKPFRNSSVRDKVAPEVSLGYRNPLRNSSVQEKVAPDAILGSKKTFRNSTVQEKVPKRRSRAPRGLEDFQCAKKSRSSCTGACGVSLVLVPSGPRWTAGRTPLPHAPGARMTVVHERTPPNNMTTLRAITPTW